jgi:threonine dehydrogenase-like Zn-dependent dehydrogenase
VIAAAGSQAKLRICKEYGGADYCVDYTKKDWQKEVVKITGGMLVDVIFDPVGLIAGQLSSQNIFKVSSLRPRFPQMHSVERQSSGRWICSWEDREGTAILLASALRLKRVVGL